ncbi:kinase-like protein [Zalerion maritima]|uniref:Kinase-like protein n=1 Tax=Zalerion maritima TaxID=339359 RepID=A0AAD5RWX2_9PEZI|nr:kinase-like protein [Zalerion maritima]
MRAPSCLALMNSINTDLPSPPKLGQHRYASLPLIPITHFSGDFEDDEAYYLITEYVEGVGMSDLTEDQKAIVRQELESHLAALKTLLSKKWVGRQEPLFLRTGSYGGRTLTRGHYEPLAMRNSSSAITISPSRTSSSTQPH